MLLIEQCIELVTVPVLLLAAGSLEEAEPTATSAAEPGGLVQEVVLVVAMVVHLFTPYCKTLLSGGKGVVQVCSQPLLLCCVRSTKHE